MAHAGETANVFTRYVRHPETLCSCGTHASACPVWAPALDAAGVGDPMRAWAAARGILTLVRDANGPSEALARTCRALLDEAAVRLDATTLVDSSNWPAYATLLHDVARGRIGYIHLVRDPRGAIHSRTRKGVKRRLRGAPSARVLVSIVRDSHRWNAWNRDAAALQRLGAPFVTVRYEDLVTDPVGVLADATRTLGIPVPPISEQFVERSRRHVVWGNQGASDGHTRLVADERWREESPASRRLLCALLTARRRRAYGY